MMTTFYICRHGQTENNKNRRLSGWIDTPLTAEGRQNAIACADKLRGVSIDKIISSDQGRAFTTAYIISRQIGFTAEIQQRRELREVNYGDLANMPYHTYPEISPEENTNYLPPNGESLAHMQKRVLVGIDEMSLSHPDKNILLVGHDGTINSVRSIFSNQSIGALDAVHNPHDLVAKFTYDQGRVLSFAEL